MVQEQIESAFGNLHPEEANTFRVVAAALSTETHLDPVARKQVTAMYVHAMKQLRADMLRPAVSLVPALLTNRLAKIACMR